MIGNCKQLCSCVFLHPATSLWSSFPWSGGETRKVVKSTSQMSFQPQSQCLPGILLDPITFPSPRALIDLKLKTRLSPFSAAALGKKGRKWAYQRKGVAWGWTMEQSSLAATWRLSPFITWGTYFLTLSAWSVHQGHKSRNISIHYHGWKRQLGRKLWWSQSSSWTKGSVLFWSMNIYMWTIFV